MALLTDQSAHARAAWLSCTASGFRTALACIIVGCITLFGPPALNQIISLPAFSYVTVILIVTDATLGDTLRGCWYALYASLFGILPAIFTLWLIGPARFTAPAIMAAAVAASAFAVVVVQENSHLITKRIALGQIVLVYVFALISGSETDPIMHPVGVLASTAVGVVACVLALLLPYPSLATSEVKKNFKFFTMNASMRLEVFVKAFSAEDKTSAHALISQAKCLVNLGIKFLRIIKSKQESMLWESLPVTFFKPYCLNPVEKLQLLETPLRGMEMALSNCESFPVRILNSELKDEMGRTEEHISCQIRSMPLVLATTVPENSIDHQHLSANLQTISVDHQDLPSFFFLYCLKLLEKKSMASLPLSSCKTGSVDSQKQEEVLFKRIWKNLGTFLNSKRLMPAFKCSLSLGLAVFLGSVYSKENAHWAGLPVAISLAAAREATFRVANLKAQGTVLGTVYGVFGCFVFQKYVLIRLLSLLPWFIFCSFLRRSRMYGPAGGISAVIGAVLILGRKNFGPPSEFAITRITETFIGLACSISVDIIFQPTRAANLSKLELSKNLRILRDSVGGISLTASKANLEESLKNLKIQVNELGKLTGEAELEPNFWFLPFPSACYGKLLASLSKLVDFIAFTTTAIESLHQESVRIETNLWKENVENINLSLNSLKHLVCTSIMGSEEVNLVRSLKSFDKEIETQKISTDLESGKPASPFMITFSSSNEEMMEKNFSTFLQHCKQVVDGMKAEKEVKSQVVLGLSSLAFCINGIIRETKEIEKGMKELVQWENPSRHVDLQEISSKIRALAAAKTASNA